MADRLCTIEGCQRRHKSRGLCHTHYMRLRRRGDPAVTLLDRAHPETCTVDGCSRPWRSRGYCGMHLQRFYKNPCNSTRTSNR
jgi:hypothetical protein